MRNAEAITAISAKIAAHISQTTGKAVPAITAEEAEQAIAAGELAFLAYSEALGGVTLFSGYGDIGHTINHLGMYAEASARPLSRVEAVWPHEQGLTAEEIASVREEDQLALIPREFWPDAPDGGSRSDEAMYEADADLAAVYDYNPEEAPHMREYQLRGRRERAARYLPSGFVPEGEGEAAAAERDLAAWGAMRAARDEIVRRALAAGATKTRVHEITGISRATIDRIPGV